MANASPDSHPPLYHPHHARGHAIANATTILPDEKDCCTRSDCELSSTHTKIGCISQIFQHSETTKATVHLQKTGLEGVVGIFMDGDHWNEILALPRPWSSPQTPHGRRILHASPRELPIIGRHQHTNRFDAVPVKTRPEDSQTRDCMRRIATCNAACKTFSFSENSSVTCKTHYVNYAVDNRL